jgi:hypothetical protein
VAQRDTSFRRPELLIYHMDKWKEAGTFSSAIAQYFRIRVVQHENISCLLAFAHIPMIFQRHLSCWSGSSVLAPGCGFDCVSVDAARKPRLVNCGLSRVTANRTRGTQTTQFGAPPNRGDSHTQEGSLLRPAPTRCHQRVIGASNKGRSLRDNIGWAKSMAY